MWEQAISELIDELNKAKGELQKAKEGLKQAETSLQKAKAEQKEAEDRDYRCEQVASVVIDEIKARVDAHIAQAHKEAVSDTC